MRKVTENRKMQSNDVFEKGEEEGTLKEKWRGFLVIYFQSWFFLSQLGWEGIPSKQGRLD